MRLSLPRLVYLRVRSSSVDRFAFIHHLADLPDRALRTHDRDAHAVVAHIDPALGTEEILVAARDLSGFGGYARIADADADGGVGDVEGEGDVEGSLVARGRVVDGGT